MEDYIEKPKTNSTGVINRRKNHELTVKKPYRIECFQFLQEICKKRISLSLSVEHCSRCDRSGAKKLRKFQQKFFFFLKKRKKRLASEYAETSQKRLSQIV